MWVVLHITCKPLTVQKLVCITSFVFLAGFKTAAKNMFLTLFFQCILLNFNNEFQYYFVMQPSLNIYSAVVLIKS